MILQYSAADNALLPYTSQKDLELLSECQKATGLVRHTKTKKMDDWDLKLFLELDNKYDFLLN
jgi:hypothetical protein